jgi:hypothetical protein
MRPLAVLALLVGLARPAAAHRASDSLLALEVDGASLSGSWAIALRDLDETLRLDADGDLAITAGELRAASPRVAAHALGALAVRADGAPCSLAVAEVLAGERDGGADAVLLLEGRCPAAPRALEIEDHLLFDLDPTHRGLVRVVAGRETHAGVTAPAASTLTFAIGARDAWREAAGFVLEGVVHIWEGTDHVLFLLVLLLPAVLRRERRGWVPADELWRVGADVLKIVTAFTVAHSLTLALSVLEIVRPPAQLVEVAIAVTVVLAALNNLVPLSPARWPVAFYLGLLHGFGFSNVLADLGVRGASAAAALVGFNLGVELGQAAIVVVFLPIAFALRRTWVYRRLLLAGGSTAVVAIAAWWTIARLA